MLVNRFYLKKSVKMFTIWTNMKMCRVRSPICFNTVLSQVLTCISTGTFMTLNDVLVCLKLKTQTK